MLDKQSECISWNCLLVFFTFDSLNTDFMLMIFTLVFQLFFNRGGGYVVVENGVIVLDLCC